MLSLPGQQKSRMAEWLNGCHQSATYFTATSLSITVIIQSAIGFCEFVETRHAVSLQKRVAIRSTNLNCAWYNNESPRQYSEHFTRNANQMTLSSAERLSCAMFEGSVQRPIC